MAEQTRRRIKFPEVVRKVGSTRHTIRNWVEQHDFPPPHKLSISPDNLWFEDEVDDWLEAHFVKLDGFQKQSDSHESQLLAEVSHG